MTSIISTPMFPSSVSPKEIGYDEQGSWDTSLLKFWERVFYDVFQPIIKSYHGEIAGLFRNLVNVSGQWLGFLAEEFHLPGKTRTFFRANSVIGKNHAASRGA